LRQGVRALTEGNDTPIDRDVAVADQPFAGSTATEPRAREQLLQAFACWSFLGRWFWRR
jgi:hypothetical protein